MCINYKSEYLESTFLNKTLLYLSAYRTDEELGLKILDELNKMNSKHHEVLGFMRKTRKYLNYNSNGEKIEDFYDYINSINSKDTKEKILELNRLRRDILEEILYDRNEFSKIVAQYNEEVNNHIDYETLITQTKKNKIIFNYSFDDFLLKNNLCTALEILSLAFTNHIPQTSSFAKNKQRHILESVNEASLIENVIHNLAIILNLETYLEVEECIMDDSSIQECLLGNFEDGSSFTISPYYRPTDFGCKDTFEYRKKAHYLLDDFNDFKEINDEPKMSFKNYIEQAEPENEFSKQFKNKFNEKISITLRIPTISLSTHDYIGFGKVSSISDEKLISLHFTFNRCPMMNLTSERAEILQIKSKYYLQDLINEGIEILDNYC